jgi:hypothetical protein
VLGGEQATDYRRSVAGEHRNGGAAAVWSLVFFSFSLSHGKLAAMEYSQYSACSGGNVFLDPWSGHVNTDCGRNGR